MESSQQLQPQSQTEILNIVESYLSRRGVQSNWLIGKGVILEPPFRAEAGSKHGKILICITGKTRKVRVLCSKVVTSQYRSDITFVLAQEKKAPLLRKFTPLQLARRQLLSIIPPNSSMSKEKYIEATKKKDGVSQTDAPRRWRELRTEYGFDVSVDNRVYKRGRAELPIYEPNPRPDMQRLNRDHWESVYHSHKGQCNKCGRKIQFREGDEGVPGLLDHRSPVLFGGGDKIENLQLFCHVCNNTKNSICRLCPFEYHCQACTWAYPEYFHDTLVIRLEPAEAQNLVMIAEEEGKEPRAFAQELFDEALRERTSELP